MMMEQEISLGLHAHQDQYLGIPCWWNSQVELKLDYFYILWVSFLGGYSLSWYVFHGAWGRNLFRLTWLSKLITFECGLWRQVISKFWITCWWKTSWTYCYITIVFFFLKHKRLTIGSRVLPKESFYSCFSFHGVTSLSLQIYYSYVWDIVVFDDSRNILY